MGIFCFVSKHSPKIIANSKKKNARQPVSHIFPVCHFRMTESPSFKWSNQNEMNALKTTRWRQRFQNLTKAFNQLERGLAITHPSDIEQHGIIQSFEFSFELSWKTLKDYLEAQGVMYQFPREVIKNAFQDQILTEGELWLDMLSKRNLLAHTYDETLAMEAYRLIKEKYSPPFFPLIRRFKKLSSLDPER
jgi:nucleotidyltransferase substrate binding protein (TIGR01987 family)